MIPALIRNLQSGYWIIIDMVPRKFLGQNIEKMLGMKYHNMQPSILTSSNFEAKLFPSLGRNGFKGSRQNVQRFVGGPTPGII